MTVIITRVIGIVVVLTLLALFWLTSLLLLWLLGHATVPARVWHAGGG